MNRFAATVALVVLVSTNAFAAAKDPMTSFKTKGLVSAIDWDSNLITVTSKFTKLPLDKQTQQANLACGIMIGTQRKANPDNAGEDCFIVYADDQIGETKIGEHLTDASTSWSVGYKLTHR